MYLEKFEIEYNGTVYNYHVGLHSWRSEDMVLCPKDVPNAVKRAREALIDAMSQLDLTE